MDHVAEETESHPTRGTGLGTSPKASTAAKGGRRLGVAFLVLAVVTDLLASPAAAKSKKVKKTETEGPTAVAVDGAADAESAGVDPVGGLGSMYHVVDQVGARALWERGVTGAGIDVAVIDTGWPQCRP